jgi:DNA-binding PadR family transcriptional regulator
LSELFPEGLIEKFGKRNTTEYMFNLDVLLELKKPEEAIQLDVSVVDEFREYINIDNELSIEILSALRQFGDLRSADIKKIIESSGGIKITKNRFYRAIKRLKDNSLIEADAGNSGAEKQNPIYSISNIDFDSYRENQIQKKQKSANKMVRKSYREKKSIKERIKTKDSNDNHAAVDDIKITKAVLATSSNLDSVSEDDIEGLLKEYEITWEELLKILKNIKSTTSLTLLEFSADMSSFNLTGYAKHAIEKGKNLISS